MLVKEEYAKFKSNIFNKTKVIQYLKLMRWHFCQVYVYLQQKYVLRGTFDAGWQEIYYLGLPVEI